MQQGQAQQVNPGVARRGVLAGVAAAVAGLLARVTERPAAAVTGYVKLGESSYPGNPDGLNDSTNIILSLPGYPRDYVFSVDARDNTGRPAIDGIYARGAGGGSGVLGMAPGTTLYQHGKCGVIGLAPASLSGVIGSSGHAFLPTGFWAGVLGVAPAGTNGTQGISGSPGPASPTASVGVGGTSSSGMGVVGTSSSNVGVHGLSTSNDGVFGNSGSGLGVHGVSNGQTAVFGNSLTGVGTRGDSQQGPGVIGTSNLNNGVFGLAGQAGNGVFGQSSSGNGVLGQATNGGNGVQGLTTSGAGVFGSAGAGTGVFGTSGSGAGVAGSSANNNAVFGDAGAGGNGLFGRTVSGNGLVAQATGGGNAAQFFGNVIVQGNFTVAPGFAKSGAVTFGDGSVRRLYAVEAPESWFEDFGSAQLVDGRANVRIDPGFAQAANLSAEYFVFLTSRTVEVESLAVTLQAPDHFEVQANGKGAVNGSFAYRIVAKRKDVPGVRFERITLGAPPTVPALDAAVHAPVVPIPAKLPDLPAGAREIPPVPPAPDVPVEPRNPGR